MTQPCDPSETCAALPTTSFSVDLVFCHAHMAWHVHSSATHQTGDEVELIEAAHVVLGPFDDLEAIKDVAITAIDSFPYHFRLR